MNVKVSMQLQMTLVNENILENIFIFCWANFLKNYELITPTLSGRYIVTRC